MMITKNKSDLAKLILRVGLGLVFVWFGIDHIVNFTLWNTWVPSWAENEVITATHYTIAIGIGDIVLGGLLVAGWWVRYTCLLLMFQLIFVIVVVIGYSDIAVRDFGILVGITSLYVMQGVGKR